MILQASTDLECTVRSFDRAPGQFHVYTAHVQFLIKEVKKEIVESGRLKAWENSERRM